MQDESIGFIGLGNMGQPISSNLLRAGYRLVVYDILEERVEEMVSQGAIRGTSPRDVASKSDVVMTSLPTPEALESVLAGRDGVLEAGREGMVIVLLDTISPITARRIARMASLKGVEVLDAPVSGGPYLAREGALTIMVGGDRKVFERCRHVLEKIGKNIFYVGGIGSGSVVKLVNNLLSLGNVALMCEALILGVIAGVDAKTIYEVVSKSTGRSFALEYKLPNIIAKRRFEGGFAIDLACKDLGIISSLSRELDYPLFMGSVVEQIYRLAKMLNLGREDHTAVVKIFEGLAGLSINF
ncbi:2-(hydroxymethyl)glutarate dehydrogenase [archaeon HR01]|nr:2-(hydroxymethyl)glutarate dehydrogenase [archaeon HR01]